MQSEPPEGAAYPLVLRRLPALVVAVVSLGTGAGLLVLSSALSDDRPWWSGVLVNLGSSIVLLVPLLGMTAAFGRVLVRQQQARDRRVGVLEADVRAVRRTVEEVAASISADAVAGLAADRAGDQQLIADVAASPTPEVVGAALRLGHEMRFTSAQGPRVPIFDTDLYARWELGDGSAAVFVRVERVDGTPVDSLAWEGEASAADLGYRLGRLLQARGRYPGDIAFQPGQMFMELHELLLLGFRSCTGADGLVDSVGPIVQLAGDLWLITDRSVTTRDWPHYEITLDRLDELDWDAHMRPRDMDIGGFRQAMDTARALLQSGRLVAPEPRRWDE